MDQNIPQSDDLCPGYFGITASAELGYSTRGFSNDLQVMNHPDLKHFIASEIIEVSRDAFFDLRNRPKDVIKAIRVASHRGMASR